MEFLGSLPPVAQVPIATGFTLVMTLDVARVKPSWQHDLRPTHHRARPEA